VPRNQREAAKYFRRAAGKGYALAQHRLARAYELGQGLRQNLVEAYRWYSLSAKSLETSRLNLEAMTSRMTAAQLAQAQTATNQIIAKLDGLPSAEETELRASPVGAGLIPSGR
jgi:TPR repeat protein